MEGVAFHYLARGIRDQAMLQISCVGSSSLVYEKSAGLKNIYEVFLRGGWCRGARTLSSKSRLAQVSQSVTSRAGKKLAVTEKGDVLVVDCFDANAFAYRR
jgi:hypothetical protein